MALLQFDEKMFFIHDLLTLITKHDCDLGGEEFDFETELFNCHSTWIEQSETDIELIDTLNGLFKLYHRIISPAFISDLTFLLYNEVKDGNYGILTLVNSSPSSYPQLLNDYGPKVIAMTYNKHDETYSAWILEQFDDIPTGKGLLTY